MPLKKQRRLGLRARLTLNAQLILLYGGLMGISVLLLSTFSFSSVRTIVADLKLQNTREVVEQIRNNVDTNLMQINELSYGVFANADVLRILRENQHNLEAVTSRERILLEELLTNVLFARDDIKGLVLYANNGRSIRTQAPPRDLSFETVQTLANRADGALTWVPRLVDDSTIVAVRKIYDAELTPLGYLEIDTSSLQMRQRLSESIDAIGGTVVVSQDGEPILDSRTGGTQGANSIVVPERIDGSGLLEIGDRIVVSSESRVQDWLFTATVPLSAIYEDIRYLRTLTLLASAVTVMIFVLVSSLIARGFVRPVHEIAEQMKAASIGDWSPSLAAAPNNEIAYLASEFTHMIGRMNTLVARLVESESRTARQQLEVLQAQINPHFLYNALDVVSWMARRQDAPKIAEIVGALSTIMRYSISKESMTSLQSELSHVEKYVLIQRARFRDKFSVELDVPNEYGSLQLPKLTLQPLVENAILHGFRSLDRPALLQVYAHRTEECVEIHVSDNGIGMETDRQAELLRDERIEHGIGIANVHRRLQLIFGDEFGLSIKSELGLGTDCIVRVPRSKGGIPVPTPDR